MKWLLCVLATFICVQAEYSPWPVPYNIGTDFDGPCPEITAEVSLNFRRAVYETTTLLFKKIISLSDAHFTFSPVTIWQALAAIAEGSDGEARQELYRFLYLPENKCERQMFYHLASIREIPNHDVVLDRKRLFVIDSSVHINPYWENFVRNAHLVDVISAPFKSNPAQIESWRQTFNAQLPNLNPYGNSIILESLDYHGLWTSSFPESTIVQEPFFNTQGEEIATIEYMKMRARATMAYLPGLNMKVLQLPVGKDNSYVMMFGISMGQGSFRSSLEIIQSDIIFKSLSNFRKSQTPVDVVIPRIAMTSETDVRKVLEELGIRGLWADSYATRNISEPAALPSSYIQRTTVTLDNKGLKPSIQEFANFIPPLPQDTAGLDPAVGTDFIANRPFIFGLFDTQTFTCLFAASFSKPNYLTATVAEAVKVSL